jgi:hypothetical protein
LVLIAVAASLSVAALGARQRFSPSSPPFTDVTERSGLDFLHGNGAQGRLLLPEVIGSGGALLDFDNDGDLDLFLVQGSASSNTTGADTSRLFRNDSTRGVSFHFHRRHRGKWRRDLVLGDGCRCR